MEKQALQAMLSSSIISFTLTDGTVVNGETPSNIRYELVSTHKVRKLPPISIKFGLLLDEMGMKKGRGQRDGYGKTLDIYYVDPKPNS